MNEKFDVVVLGAGPGGEVVVSRLTAKGLHVTLVKRELIGGECAYWACVPRKTLLRPPEISEQAARGAGIDAGALDWARASACRDYMVSDYDDRKRMEE